MAPTYVAEVKISLKDGVADPEGKNTLKAIDLLGYDGVKNVSSSKLFTIDVDVENVESAQELLNDVCRRLLANPVIHNFDVDIQEK